MRHHQWWFTAIRKVTSMAYQQWLIRNQRLALSSFRMETAAMVVTTTARETFTAVAGMAVADMAMVTATIITASSDYIVLITTH